MVTNQITLTWSITETEGCASPKFLLHIVREDLELHFGQSWVYHPQGWNSYLEAHNKYDDGADVYHAN